MHSFKAAGKSTRISKQFQWVQPKDRIKNWTIFTGDKVAIIAGKDKGKKGEVKEVRRDINSVIVKGHRLVKKHVWNQQSAPEGKTEIEQPIHVSNVMLLHPETGKPTKIDLRKASVEWHDGTKKIKYCRFVHKEDIIIPKPPFVIKRPKEEESYSTDPEEALKATFEPVFEEYPLPEGVIDELRNPYRRKWEPRPNA